MNRIRLSIVIPVYNLENYIAETLDSCLKQDIPAHEYEIVCVDDGSKDGSLDVLNHYAQTYSNITVYAKENGGVSSARNKGIELARGDYIWFVDGDDLIAENAIGRLLSFVEENRIDALKFDMRHTDTRTSSPAQISLPIICADPEEIPSFMTMKGGIGGGVCVLWFRRELLLKNELRFAELIHYSEDVLFGYQALLCSKRAAKTDSIIYDYYRRPGSAMHSGNLLKHAQSMHLLAREYDKMATQYKGSFCEKTIQSKRSYAIKAMIFSLIQLGDVALMREKLDAVTKEGLYPFAFLAESLKNNQTWKQTLINYLSFLFPCRWYVLLCVRLMALKKTIKR